MVSGSDGNTLLTPRLARRCTLATLLHHSRCSRPAKAHFRALVCAGPGLHCAAAPVMSLPTPSTPWIAALPLHANCRCSLAHLIQRAGEDVQCVAVLHQLRCYTLIELLGLAVVRRCVLEQVLKRVTWEAGEVKVDAVSKGCACLSHSALTTQSLRRRWPPCHACPWNERWRHDTLPPLPRLRLAVPIALRHCPAHQLTSQPNSAQHPILCKLIPPAHSLLPQPHTSNLLPCVSESPLPARCQPPCLGPLCMARLSMPGCVPGSYQWAAKRPAAQLPPAGMIKQQAAGEQQFLWHNIGKACGDVTTVA